MIELFRALAGRVKSLFAADAALEFEAEFLARAAEHKAELLRQAERYDKEGLRGIALHLRRQADELSDQRPLAGVLPALNHLTGLDAVVSVPSAVEKSAAAPAPPTLTSPKKKRR